MTLPDGRGGFVAYSAENYEAAQRSSRWQPGTRVRYATLTRPANTEVPERPGEAGTGVVREVWFGYGPLEFVDVARDESYGVGDVTVHPAGGDTLEEAT